MIIVDGNEFGQLEYERQCFEWGKQLQSRKIRNRVVAVCMKQPLGILAAIHHLRQSEASLLLINGETPIQTATETAKRSGCTYLVYEDIGTLIPIGGTTVIEEPSLLQYSSGTTGEPKQIARPWRDIDVEIASYNAAIQAEEWETPIIFVPVYHSFGLIAGTLSALARQTKPRIVTGRNPKAWLHEVHNTPNSILYAVPFLLHLMLSFPSKGLAFHRVVSSGSPLTEPLFRKLTERCDQLSQQYGCTEAGCIAFSQRPSKLEEVGELLDHFTAPTMPNKESVGEIGVFYKDKFIQTGDVGYMSDKRSIHLLGRLDDLINVAGLKVAPGEVEQVIVQLEGIQEVVVYKTKHPVWGEAVKALVVCKGLTAEEIRAWCIAKLPPFKVPRVIEMVKAIPRLPSGKISRKLLLEREMS